LSSTPDSPFSGLAGRRLLLAAKEAGAGSLLAALLPQLRPAPGSLCLVSETAASYFAQSDIETLRLGEAAPGMGEGELAALIERTEPEAIVCGASAGASIEKLALVAGTVRGIPVASFVDHYWNLWQRFADEETAARWAYLPDLLCVPAEQCARNIVAAGCPQERVRVFAHPLLEGAAAPAPVDRAAARAALGLPAEATVWLFVSEYGFPLSDLWQWEQPPESDIEGLLRLLLEKAAQAPENLLVAVKKHPAERRDWAPVCAEYPGVSTRIIGAADKAALFSASDAAFGLNSMLLLEAARAGVPAFSHHVSGDGRETWLSTIRPEVVEVASDDRIWRKLRR